MMTSTDVATIPHIKHAEAMRITAVENATFATALRKLQPEDWTKLTDCTDCTGWTVRDVVVHLIASAQAQANPIEFVRQVSAGRPLTARDRRRSTGSTGSTRRNSAPAPTGRRRCCPSAGSGTPRRRSRPDAACPRRSVRCRCCRSAPALGRTHRLAAAALPVRHGLHP